MRLTEFLAEIKTEDANDISLMEQRLIENRNIINVDDATEWAEGEAGNAAIRLTHDKSIQTTVFNWMKKALRKYVLLNAQGKKIKIDTNNNAILALSYVKPVTELPPWAQQVLKSGEDLVYITPANRHGTYDPNKDVRLVSDWLSYKLRTAPEQITPNRLSRISFENAIKLSDDYHEELARKRPASMDEVEDWYLLYMYREMKEPWAAIKEDKEKLKYVTRAFTKATGRKVSGAEDSPEGHVLVKEYNDGNKWIKLTTQDCLNYEGTQMGHCVADYGHEVDSGSVDIISLRDKTNNPHVTIEFANESATVSQIKGKENKAPIPKYIPYVIDMLNDLYKKHGILKYADMAEMDLAAMGMIEEAGIVKMVTPPFESESFSYQTVYTDENGDTQFHARGKGKLYDAIEETMADYESMSDLMYNDILYVLNQIMVKGKWEGKEDEVVSTIWYDGQDKDVKRSWEQAVPKP